jgi:hypothetical protein
MKSRALLLIAALLASPSWADESATRTQVLSPESFDRKSDSIRKIVRDFAATQSMPVQLVAERPTADSTIEFVPAEPKHPEPPAPRLPDAPPASDDSFFSAMIGTLVEAGIEGLLDVDDSYRTCVSNGTHCVSSDPLPPAPTHER